MLCACGNDTKPPTGPHPPGTDTPPQVSFETLPTDVWEQVPIAITIKDPEGDRAALRVMWAPPGGTFSDATPVTGQKVMQLPTSKAGRTMTFVWDSRANIGEQNMTGVVLAAVASDRGGTGPMALSPAVAVRNKVRIVQVAAGDPGETITVQGRGFGTDATAVRVQFSTVPQMIQPVDVAGNVMHVVVPSDVGAGTLLAHVGGDWSNPATFAPKANPKFADGPALGLPSSAAVAADVDGDGHIDLVQNGVQRNAGGGAFVATGVGAGTRVLAADVDGDGRCDLVTFSSGGAAVLHQDSSGSFTASSFDTTVTSTSDVAFIDVYEDGMPDVVAVHVPPSGAARLWFNTGGSFLRDDDPMLEVVPASDALAVADFDGDGHQDLILGRDDGVTLLSSLGHGMFAARLNAFGSTSAKAALFAVAGDIDRDGLPDLVTAVPLTWRHTLASGGFVAPQQFPLVWDPTFATLADVNDDGNLDLYVVAPGHVLLYVATPSGFVEQAAAAGLTAPANPSGALAADFDGDGRLDLYDGERIHWNRMTVATGHVEIWLGGAWAGARAILSTPDGRRQIRAPESSALPIHFGLGASDQAQLEIDWASGKKTMRAVAPGDRLSLPSP